MNEKILGVLIGVVVTLTILGIIGFVSQAHIEDSSRITGTSRSLQSMQPMMGQNGMHGMMMGMDSMHGDSDDDMMGCMSMMNEHEEMTEEEIEEMIKAMDKDGDGKCDMCGMSVEGCKEMMSSGEEMHESMHSEMHGNANEMNCPMHNK